MGKQRIPLVYPVVVTVLFLISTSELWARPTTREEARLVVAGWLTDNAEPFGAQIGGDVANVETFTGDAGEPVYHVVHLNPAGFVVVPADDLVEPILTFADGQDCEPSPHDPLMTLVTADINRRIAAAYSNTSAQISIQSVTDAQTRWSTLIGRADFARDGIGILSRKTISDIRVAPLLKTRWAQGSICSKPGYDYYTPRHYVAGCVATSMAQLMYYYRHPANGIGWHSFTISVLGDEQILYTRGGDGLGGPYRWTDMVPVPNCSTTAKQREAIGALCYDAGVAVGTNYDPQGSSADAFAIAKALREVFGFSNGINGANGGNEIGSGLANMINPNLDAQCPVILAITGDGGHAALVDGYGYDPSVRQTALYHHLNMGWGGYSDVWYNLPDTGNYDTVVACIYNIFVSGQGEIISGRITDGFDRPVVGASVKATRGRSIYTATTNDKGVYALIDLPPASTFTIEVSKPGLIFTKQTVRTGTSRDWKASAGNKWGVDFTGRSVYLLETTEAASRSDPAGLAAAWVGDALASNPQ